MGVPNRYHLNNTIATMKKCQVSIASYSRAFAQDVKKILQAVPVSEPDVDTGEESMAETGDDVAD